MLLQTVVSVLLLRSLLIKLYINSSILFSPMNNKPYLFLLLLCFVWLLQSCTTNPIFKIDTLRESDDSMYCNKTFGKDVNTIKNLNEFWFQTGKMDTGTVDNSPLVKAGIISIDKKRNILYLKNTHTINDTTIEVYTNNIFIVTLSYTQKENEYNEIFYIGDLIIDNTKQKEDYKIEGIDCRL